MSSNGDYPDRPPSEQLVDLHVYIVPTDMWRSHLNSAVNQIINDTISAGFIRVSPDLSLDGLRQEAADQLGDGTLPQDYIFLRSVGRCFTKVQPKQEFILRAKNYLPPQSYGPEIYVLETSENARYSRNTEPALHERLQNTSDTMRTYSGGKAGFNQKKRIPPIQNGHSNRLPTIAGSQYQSQGAPSRTSQQPTLAGQYEPPHSDSPPHSPERTRQGEPVPSNPTSGDSGIADMDNGERRRMQDLLKKQHDIDERRRHQLDELETFSGAMSEEEQQWQLAEKQRWQADRHRWEKETNQLQQSDDRRPQPQGEEHDPGPAWKEEQRYTGRNPVHDNADGVQRRLHDQEYESEEETKEDEINLTKDLGEMSAEEKEEERMRLQDKLEEARSQRKDMEKAREELVKRAKQLQNRTQQRRNQARDVWKKKYFEEKKRTNPLEEQSSKLRSELENLHRRIMSQLEGSKGEPTPRGVEKPSQASNMKIHATKLQHTIEELQRKVDNIKMKLAAEMKLRSQAEGELRALRAELTQKKINVTLTRSQQLAALEGGPDITSSRSNAGAVNS